MSQGEVKASGLSRGATILMLVLGVITLLIVNEIAGVALIALGVAMYLFNRWYLARARRPRAAATPS